MKMGELRGMDSNLCRPVLLEGWHENNQENDKKIPTPGSGRIASPPVPKEESVRTIPKER